MRSQNCVQELTDKGLKGFRLTVQTAEVKNLAGGPEADECPNLALMKCKFKYYRKNPRTGLVPRYRLVSRFFQQESELTVSYSRMLQCNCLMMSTNSGGNRVSVKQSKGHYG